MVRVGEKVEVSIVRDGERQAVEVRIGHTPGELLAESRLVDKLERAEFQDLAPGHPSCGSVKGVLAARVEAGSPAARSGLRPGDIVVAVNRTEVSTVHEFADAVRSSKSAIALSILRDGMRLFLVIQ